MKENLIHVHGGLGNYFNEFPEFLISDSEMIDKWYIPPLKYKLDYYALRSYAQKFARPKRGREGDAGWRPAKKIRKRFKVRTSTAIMRSYSKRRRV